MAPRASKRTKKEKAWTASPEEERELLEAIAGAERGETVPAREVIARLRASSLKRSPRGSQLSQKESPRGRRR